VQAADSVLCPAKIPYLPAAHNVHDVAPVLVVYEPAAQSVHDARFPADDLEVPAGQTVQAPARVSAVAPALAK
jgi:hypothetical protein